jgi:hypothetical protein
MVESVLDLVMNVLNDPETLPIVLESLEGSHHRQRATILAGLFGKKARKAIPWVRYHAGGVAFPQQAQFALRHLGASRKNLYTGLRIAIRERDAEGFLRLIDFIAEDYPGFESDPEFERILDSASRIKLRMKDIALQYLSELPIQARLQFKSIIQRLASDQDPEIRASAIQLLSSIN